jgi:hypothetical protein
MAIFAGLQVKIGKNDFNSASNLVYVPIHHGSMDRVVASIMSENTTNKPIRVPAMAVTLASIEMAPEKRKGIGTHTRYPTMPRGGSFPDDLKIVELGMAIPYTAVFELAIIVSNTQQHLQIMEQILMLFDPTLQIQLSDDPHDWRKISLVELTKINLDEHIPAGTDARLITSSLIFQTTCYLSPPAVIKTNFIKSIRLRLDAIKNSDNLYDVVNDVNRALPPYEELINVDKLNFPKS